MQRLRITYARGDELRYVSHLDMARLWERAVRRAGLPLFYSRGFTPHARISIAAPLAVGVTAAAELLDLYLEEPVPPAEAQARLYAQLPAGLTISDVTEVDQLAPSLQSQMRAAEYLATFREPLPSLDLGTAVQDLLARESIPYERRREGKVKALDLRPFLQALSVATVDGRPALRMRLRMDTAGSVRPDEVLDALSLAAHPVRLHRERVILAE
ncbi:MAG: TIGR03936 family radical SAM-associated protein [Dehalococcoidales bacterium]|nr:TIGR03936 family radical SAM-associated protein [Dehalococcoidales bacterium]